MCDAAMSVKSIKMPDDIFSSHFVAASLHNASQ
jgi:hypothetical protein